MAPGAPETTPKGGARSTSLFGMVSGAPGAVQTPNIDDFWSWGVGIHDHIDTKLGLGFHRVLTGLSQGFSLRLPSS